MATNRRTFLKWSAALGGDFKASQWVLERARAIEHAAAAEWEKDFEYATAYKQHWEREFWQAKFRSGSANAGRVRDLTAGKPTPS